jgi:hypothetical protein
MIQNIVFRSLKLRTFKYILFRKLFIFLMILFILY